MVSEERAENEVEKSPLELEQVVAEMPSVEPSAAPCRGEYVCAPRAAKDSGGDGVLRLTWSSLGGGGGGGWLTRSSGGSSVRLVVVHGLEAQP